MNEVPFSRIHGDNSACIDEKIRVPWIKLDKSSKKNLTLSYVSGLKIMNSSLTKLIILNAVLLSAVSCSRTPDYVLEPNISPNLSNPSSSVSDEPTPTLQTLTASDEKTSSSILETLKENFTIFEPVDLLNGNSLENWRSLSGEEPNGWILENDILRLTNPQNGNDLVTKSSFSNFIFSFEWRIGLECNSGVKYKLTPHKESWVGLEYHIQDDAHVEDGKIENRKLASLFDILPARASSQSSQYPAPSQKEPLGEFRRGKILVVGNHVEHWLDDECVLLFEVGSPEWNEAKGKSKFKKIENYGKTEQAPILLQSHGYPVDFRNLTIQEITPKKAN